MCLKVYIYTYGTHLKPIYFVKLNKVVHNAK